VGGPVRPQRDGGVVPRHRPGWMRARFRPATPALTDHGAVLIPSELWGSSAAPVRRQPLLQHERSRA
jgi:hypothetical protein